MKILYITYIDFDANSKSGSFARPKKIYKAFLDLNINVKLLECQQNKFKERRNKVKEILKWLNNNKPDICYIESPSGPIFNLIDLKLIKKVHKLGIPIGFFYRDAFWLFPEKIKSVGFIKSQIIILLNKIQIYVLKNNCDILYMPTNSMIELFAHMKLKRIDTLPPGTEIKYFTNDNKQLKRNCIYVGAVSEIDGTFEIIKAFELLNEKRNKNISLTIVCRETEWEEKINVVFKNKPRCWLNVIHASGDELIELYNNADVGLHPRLDNMYMNIAFPFKLCEYLGFGKPVIATRRKEVEAFIEENRCGMLCDDDYISIADTVEDFYADEVLREELYKNVKIAASKNQWTDRVKKIVEDLNLIKNS